MNTHIQTCIEQATSKAFASMGKEGIHVIPVSTIRVVDGYIWLFNYFMNRTKENIIKNPNVSLTCWSEMKGYQIKGIVQYHTDGELYHAACAIVKELHPERILYGLIILEPKEIFSVSPGDSSIENLLSPVRQGATTT